jgi:hypothetical protein
MWRPPVRDDEAHSYQPTGKRMRVYFGKRKMKAVIYRHVNISKMRGRPPRNVKNEH